MRAIFLDQETTGLDALKHRTIDIAFTIIDLPKDKVLNSYQTIVRQPDEVWTAKDPSSVKVNGFTQEMLQTGKAVDLVSEEIVEIFTGLSIHRDNAVFICQNPAFDRGFFNHLVSVAKQEEFQWPYHWLDMASMFWALRIVEGRRLGVHFPTRMDLSKDDIARFYGMPTEEKPHRAINGVNHLILCYQQLFR